MSKFIEITEKRYGDKTLINIEQISHIFLNPPALVMTGNHGFDNGSWGLLSISQEDLDKVLEKIK